MGSWNGTCAISGLPILPADEIVMLLLAGREGYDRPVTAYADTINAQIAGTIYGEYNDYGGIEQISMDKATEDIVTHLRILSKDTEEGITRIVTDDVEKFLQACVEEESLWLENSLSLSKGALSMENGIRIKYMLVHRDIYEKLITEVGRRVPSGEKKSARELLCGRIKDRIMAIKNAGNFDPYKAESIINYGNSLLSRKYIREYLAKIVLYDEPGSAERLADRLLFGVALGLLRKGNLTLSGAGSQSAEMKIHMVLCDAMRDHVRNFMLEHHEKEDIYADELEESLYWRDEEVYDI